LNRFAVAARLLPLALLLLVSACGGARELRYDRPANARQPELAIDHVWIATPAGGGQGRAMLEAAGFRFSPTVNRHDGSGTSSTTIDFENGYFELIWADPSVPATGGGVVSQQRFASRANWRTSGESPLGIGFRRTPATPATFPFETWSVGAPWMGEQQMVILSPRGAPTVTLFMTPTPVNVEANRAAIAAGGPAAEHFLHGNGARRLTGVRVSAPTPAGLPPAASFANQSGAAVELIVGREWLMELELDFGAQNQSLDLRPTLPLIVRF
jgi:hypothetical protein